MKHNIKLLLIAIMLACSAVPATAQEISGLSPPFIFDTRITGEIAGLSPLFNFDTRNGGEIAGLSPHFMFDTRLGAITGLSPLFTFETRMGEITGLSPFFAFETRMGEITGLSPLFAFDVRIGAITGKSPLFMFDTKPPEILIVSPNGGEVCSNSDLLPVTWQNDSTVVDNSINIWLITYPDSSSYLLAENISNPGFINVGLPSVNTEYAKIKISAYDNLGFLGFDESDDYFIIAEMPTVITAEARNISEISAIAGGDVTDDGGLNITERGIYYTMDIDTGTVWTQLNLGDGTGAFSGLLEGLMSDTEYYLRAYAGNAAGTGVGNILSFTTAEMYECPPEFRHDGQQYTTLQVDGQCWMGQSLNAGTMISAASNASNNGIIEKYCQADDEANCDLYGGLYTWHEAMQYSLQQEVQGICPENWHIPSDSAWKILEGNADSQYDVGDPIWDEFNWRGFDAGKNLKTVDGWVQNSGTDLLGFSALPGGYHSSNGSFYGFGWNAFIWTSNEYDGTSAWFRDIYATYNGIERKWTNKYNAAAVRCVKDIGTTASPPTVATLPASEITNEGAVLGCDVTGDGGAIIIECGIYWANQPDPVNTGTKICFDGGTGISTSQINGLPYNTTYYVVAYARNYAGEVFGDEVSFFVSEFLVDTINILRGGPGYTNPLAVPVQIAGVNTTPYGTDLNKWNGGWGPPQAIYDQGVFVNDPDNWSNIDGSPYSGSTWFNSQPGIGYGILVVDLGEIQHLLNISAFQIFSDGKATHIAFAAHPETGATPPDALNSGWFEVLEKSPMGPGINNTNYISNPTKFIVNGYTRYVKIMAWNDGSLGYSGFIELKGVKIFGEKIITSIPEVLTATPSAITTESAVLGGNVTDDGGDEVTDRGIYWGTSPDLVNTGTQLSVGSGTGDFSTLLESLQQGTNYYCAAYATNIIGTGYGSEMNFATLAIPPLQTDSLALVALYNACNGPGWTNSSNWLAGPLSIWQGITVSGNRVSNIDLYQNNLTGTIPDEIGNLDALDSLNLARNYITGTIPQQIGNLSLLVYLDLWSNQLVDPIPESIYNLTNLRYLNLRGNNFLGEINASIGNLENLEFLNLMNNDFTGNFPEAITTLGQLQALYLGYNGLSGELPESLGNLTNLTLVALGPNNFSGSIPDTIGNLTNLETLSIWGTQLSGSLPESIGNLINLTDLDVTSNALNEPIPESIGSLVNLEKLFLYSNQITGPIPESIGNLSALKELRLFNNQISGPIPASIGNCSNLVNLVLFDNQIAGPLPETIGNLSNLKQLDIYNNLIDGSLPESLTQLSSLLQIKLNNNQLSGELPSDIGDLTNLGVFNASNNQFTGEIPVSFGNLANLNGIYLDGNQLEGDLPIELCSDLTNLIYLKLNNNNFGHAACPVIQCLIDRGGWSIITHSPQNNGFVFMEDCSGTLASDSLALVALYNASNGPGWLHHENWLTGPVKSWARIVTEGDRVKGISLYYNNLSGTIPAEVGDLTALQWLDLSGNQLTGTLPIEMGNLETLQFLVLKNNQLSDPIPAEICYQMTGLQKAYIENNDFGYGSCPAYHAWKGILNPRYFKFYPQKSDYNFYSDCGDTCTTDRTALIKLYEATHGPNWTNNSNWGNPDISTWYGVQYNHDIKRVTGLHLGNNNLNGYLPPEIGFLDLIFLQLNNNQISWHIPKNLGYIDPLIECYICYNQLNGEVPRQLGNLSQLEVLDLRNNQLSGELPMELCSGLGSIYNLTFSYNNFGEGSCETVDCLISEELIYLEHSPQNDGYVYMLDCGECEDAMVSFQLDDTLCEGNYIPVSGQAQNYKSVRWSTSGNGFFYPTNSLQATYHPGTGDIQAGEVEIYLTAYAYGNCNDATASGHLSIIRKPEITLEDHRYLDCGDYDTGTGEWLPIEVSAIVSGEDAIGWYTNGDGWFDDASQPATFYHLGENDKWAGPVTLTCVATAQSACMATESKNLKLVVPSQILSFIGSGPTGISSYVDKSGQLMQVVLAPLLNCIDYLEDENGNIFKPSEQLNEIGNWSAVGYKAEVYGACCLPIYGNLIENQTISISDGMFLPVLSNQAVDIELLFGANLDQVESIYDWETGLSWTLASPGFDSLQPGKAYLLNLNETKAKLTIEFPGYILPPPLPVISGTIIENSTGLPLEGVLLNFSGDIGITATDDTGYFSKMVPEGWSGEILPSLSNFVFGPQSISFSNVLVDQDDQDFTACYISCCDPGWEANTSTLIQTVEMPPWLEPDIGGEVINDGDLIGAFYLDDGEQEVCGGAIKWKSGASLNLLVYGDDFETTLKDGFALGETIRWKIYQCQSAETYDVFATYAEDFPNADGAFIPFGLSQIIDLSNGQSQEVSIASGWSGISSFIDPFDKSLETIFTNNQEELIIMSNFNGLYYPAQNINTLTGWEFTSGYQVKAGQDFDIMLKGSQHDGYSLGLESGWSIVPVLSSCNVPVSDVFGMGTNTQIIKEIAGTGIYWPDYEINTLGELKTGKAYFALLDGSTTVVYPGCMKSGWYNPSPVQKPINYSTWNYPVLTGQSHLVIIPQETIQALEIGTGDIIGGFTPEGICAGLVNIISLEDNHCLTLFGDDPLTTPKDGFAEGDVIFLRHFILKTKEETELLASFDSDFPNQGVFVTNGISALKAGAMGKGPDISSDRFAFSLFPNPSKEKVTLTWSQENQQPANISIYNAFGQVVKELKIGVYKSGVQSTTLNVSKLEQGTYLVKMKTGQQFGMKKLIIMK